MAGYYEGDLCLSNGCNNNGGWNSGWEWIIALALIGGFGNRGGFFGGGNGGGGDFAGWQLGRLATTNDVASGFSTSEIMSDLNSIILGQAQMQNFINQGFAGLNSTINSGFAGVDNAICTLGYQDQAGFNALGTQLADCCCKIERGIDNVNYNMATNTCAIQTSLANATRDIIDSQRCGTDRILGFLTNEKISTLQAENAALKGQISNSRQTADIVSQLRDPGCPVASYTVPNPNCCYNPFGFGFTNGYSVATANSGCGCGASIQ